MKHTITLTKNKGVGVWMATHTDPKIVELFGGDTLATAYTLNMDGEQVRTFIQERNPDSLVVLKEFHETDCMNCEETFESIDYQDFCPKCNHSRNRW